MPRLVRGREPTWITLTEATAEEPACRVLVRPFSRLGRAAATEQLQELLEEGAGPEEAFVAFVVALAAWATQDWEGVGDEAGQPIPCTPADVRELLLQHDPAYNAFNRLYATPAIQGEQEKNGSSPSPRGTSPAGAAPTTKARTTRAKARRGAVAATATGAAAKAANARTAATGRKATKAAPSGT